MNAMEWEDYDVALPARPRRALFTRATALLFAAVVGAACFYAGVRVEKDQVPSTSSRTLPAGASGAFSRLPSRGGSGTFGTVSSISGKTLYVTDASGNTVKVTLSPATKVTKSEGVPAKAVRPGDTVVVQGLRSTRGTVEAATVSDTGAGGASGAGTARSRSGSASSAVGSLFGSGG